MYLRYGQPLNWLNTGAPNGRFEKKTEKQQQSMNKGFWVSEAVLSILGVCWEKVI